MSSIRPCGTEDHGESNKSGTLLQSSKSHINIQASRILLQHAILTRFFSNCSSFNILEIRSLESKLRPLTTKKILSFNCKIYLLISSIHKVPSTTLHLSVRNSFLMDSLLTPEFRQM